MADERTETECEPVRPDSERDSRPETERREVDEREEARDDARDEDCELLRAEELPLLRPLARPPPVIPVAGELTRPLGDTTGARPQVSQYSSPPPMSS
ncbi:hypothetical protein [Streptomyces castrisilvae]|uniref:hypothetical protein n=1 Tax=Streptomyces castrisilvae TaxID=3033811 RepID=UPI0040557D7D